MPGRTDHHRPRLTSTLLRSLPMLAGTALVAFATFAPDLIAWRAPAANPFAKGPGAPAAVHAQSAGSGGPTYAVPVANYFGEDDICESWIAVQNVGNRPGQPVAAFVTDRPEGPLPITATPSPWKVPLKYAYACGGLLRPGSAWNFLGAQVPSGSRSGFILSIDGTTLAAADADAVEGDDVQGGRLCQVLSQRVQGKDAVWHDFYAAWRAGGTWEGLPLGRMAGPPLSVAVHRSCPGQRSPGSDATAAYAAPAVERAAPGRHQAAMPSLRRPAGVPARRIEGSMLHLQNVGTEPGRFTLRFQLPGACAALPVVQTVPLLPGEAAALDLELAPAGGDALALVEGDQPFAAVALPSHDDWTTSQAVASRPAGNAAPVGSALAAVLPLYEGTTRVSVDVVNNGRAPVTPRLSLFGRAGRAAGPVLPPVVGPALCPGALATLSVTVTLASGLPQPHLAWIDTSPDGAEASLAASIGVTGIGPTDQANDVRTAYRVDARSVNRFATFFDSVPLALPAAFDDLHNSGLYNVIAVARTGFENGSWDYAIDFYDHNGRTGRHCATLSNATADVVDLADLALTVPGSKASAVVSSVAFGGGPGQGEVVATALWVKGTLAPIDVPGDEWAAVGGMPVSSAWSAANIGAPCGGAVEPPPLGPPDSAPLRAAVFTPVVRFVGQDMICTAAVAITNHGTEPAAVVRIVWGEPGFCEPDCAAPLAVSCLPLIAPGATFTLIETEPANSGVFLSLNARTLGDLGLRPGDTRTGADVLCRHDPLATDCNAWRQLWLAWQQGGTFAELPLGQVVGPPITAEVERTCAAGSPRPVSGTSRYAATTGAEALAAETQGDRFVYSVTGLALAGRTDAAVLYIQNAGTRCTGIDITFVADSGMVKRCDVITLSAGESYQLDVLDCIDGPWHGTAILSSQAPLALAVDRHTNPLNSGGAVPGAVPPTQTGTPTVPVSATPVSGTPVAATRTPGGSPAARLFLPRLYVSRPR